MRLHLVCKYLPICVWAQVVLRLRPFVFASFTGAHYAIVCLVACEVSPMVQNAVLTPHYVGDTFTGATVSCFHGYRFDDGEQLKEISCTADGSWPHIGFCNSMCKLTVDIQQICPLF